MQILKNICIVLLKDILILMVAGFGPPNVIMALPVFMNMSAAFAPNHNIFRPPGHIFQPLPPQGLENPKATPEKLDVPRFVCYWKSKTSQMGPLAGGPRGGRRLRVQQVRIYIYIDTYQRVWVCTSMLQVLKNTATTL